MSNSFTANLNLEKPEVGADSNLWGGHINSDLDILDSIFTSATTRPQSTIIKSDTKWVDATTTSKAVLLSLTAINTATTRTWTAQNTSGTVAFTADIATATSGIPTTGSVAAATVGMVTTTGTQTLTNKTLTSPTLDSPAVNTATISGTSTGVTQSAGDSSTKLATTEFVTGAVSTATPLKLLAACKATGTTRNAQFNVASVTKNSTGNFTFNFTANISANAIITATAFDASSSGDCTIVGQATDSATIATWNSLGSPQDFTAIHMMAFG